MFHSLLQRRYYSFILKHSPGGYTSKCFAIFHQMVHHHHGYQQDHIKNIVLSQQFLSTTTTNSSRINNDNTVIPNDGINTNNHLISTFQTLVANGSVTYDTHQIKALEELDRLRNELLVFYNYNQNNQKYHPNSSRDKYTNYHHTIGDDEEKETYYNPLSGLFKTLFQNNNNNNDWFTIDNKRNRVPKGVYLHGGVGCGKTFCMNLFYESLPFPTVDTSSTNNNNDNTCMKEDGTGNTIRKQKVHFHKFMLDIHKQMHEARMVEGIKGDVLPRVIKRVLQTGHIICFDEFQVTDVADALILRRLFTGLANQGAIVVATSNRPPRDLYLNGIQRDLFLPFIDLLEESLCVLSMWDSDTDYRLVQGETKALGVYFTGEESKIDFDKKFQKLTKNSTISSTTLSSQGRMIAIPNVSLEYNVARFTFDELCRKARGAADYLEIGNRFHTVFVENVPKLSSNDVNVARRFIIFIDAMYECHVKLIVHAAAPPHEIFEVDLDNRVCDEAFAFDRTRSRLEEMGSEEYLKSRWVGTKFS